MTFEDYCGQNSIGVVQIQLPGSIRGFTRKTSDGYVIVLNACDDDLIKKKTLSHEMCHITQDHLYHLESEAAERSVREQPHEFRFE